MTEREESIYDVRGAQEILRLACAARRRMDYFTREDLIRAAAELDVSAENVLQAEQFVKERQSELDDRAEFRRAKVRETAKSFGIGVPLVLLIILGHGYSMISHVFGAVKGMMKGLGAIFFSKSTRHELEFQGWRNKRFYLAEYGSTEPEVMLTFYFKDKACADYDALIGWLVQTNGIEPVEAAKAVRIYSQKHPKRVIRDVRPVAGSTSARQTVQTDA